MARGVAGPKGFARRDDDFYFQYHKESRTRAGFEAWLAKWVLGVADHGEFLARLGHERVDKLRPHGDLFAPAVSFNY